MASGNGYGIEARKQRWRELLDPDQPPGHVFRITYVPDQPEWPHPWPGCNRERVECAWDAYRRDVARAEWLRDDTVPCLRVVTGTEIFAEAFGCPVHRPDDNMPFALPAVANAAEAARLEVPELSTSTLAPLFDMMDELRDRAGDDAVVKMIDVQSPMDIASLIWDKNSFYMALLEEPGAVEELASKTMALLVAFLDEWFGRYGRDFIAHYPDYYMPEGITLSEDEIGVVDEEMFLELFLPELAWLSERYGQMGIHCCAHARHQWQNLLKVPNLRLVNLVQPVDVLKEAYEFFAPHTAQMHAWFGEGAPTAWPEQYPEGSRVVMEATAHSRDEALALSDGLWAACGRN